MKSSTKKLIKEAQEMDISFPELQKFRDMTIDLLHYLDRTEKRDLTQELENILEALVAEDNHGV